MRTNLAFKFFIIILFGSALGGNLHALGFAFSVYPQALLSDTLEFPVLDTIQPSTLQQPPAISDTLILPESISDTIDLLDADTLVSEPPRQRGAGFILDTKVDYSAKDSIPFDIKNQVVYLYGDADMKYGSIHLKAAFIQIDFRTKELYATGMPDSTGQIQGKPVFVDGAQSFESIAINYNFETQRGRTTQVFTEEADGFMHGDVVKMMDNKEIHISHGKYTTCDDPNPHFHISFNRAKIIPNDKIIASAPRLTIENVKTPLILPFGFFPNTKGQASGILIPSYGETNNRGFYLENGGFYWGINDYLDLSLRGDIYSRGSWATKVGSTYRKRYKYNGAFNVNYAINILGERNLPGYERNRDFRVIWNHSQDPKARPNSVFRASVNAGSSAYNRFNPTTTNDYLSNTFSSNISYSANWAGRYSFSANARHSQNTNTQQVDLSLPEITFSVARFYPLRRKNPIGKLRWYEEITMNYNMNASNQITVQEEDMFTSRMFENMKNGVQHSIPLIHSFRVLKHFNLSNSVNYNERWYFQQVEKSWAFNPDGSPTTNNPIPGIIERDTIGGFYAVRDFSYNASLNTKVYGMKQFRRGPVSAIRHVVSPSFGFTYRPDFADPYWKYYDYYDDPNFEDPVRYSYYDQFRYGVPAAGRSGSLNFNMVNNLEIKVKSSKDTISGERKIALIDNLTISSSYNLAADSLNLSDLVISGRTRLFGQFDVTYRGAWSPYAVDENGRPYNKYLWETDGKLYQRTNTSWTLNFNYKLESKTAMRGGAGAGGGMSQTPGMTPGMGFEGDDMMGGEVENEEPEQAPVLPDGVIDYTVPWSMNFAYTFSYNSPFDRVMLNSDRTINQSLSFSGNIGLTPKWRIGVRTGYSFNEKQITYTSLDIYRDLHCWELLINWVPFGFRQSYNLTLRVKSSVLQDLKLTRRTHHLDRAFQ